MIPWTTLPRPSPAPRTFTITLTWTSPWSIYRSTLGWPPGSRSRSWRTTAIGSSGATAWASPSSDRKDRKSLPHWIGWPVNDRDEWEQVKAERLRPTLEDRLPEDWAQRLEAYKTRDYPICIGASPAGFYGGARHLVGQDRILTMVYDDPAFIHDIMDYLGDFLVAIYDQVLRQVKADVCFVWEDMCYKNGPLISPAMFREFMLPNYKKLTACLRDHGVTSIMVDTDGDARLLIPLFIEEGQPSCTRWSPRRVWTSWSCAKPTLGWG